MAFVTLRIGCVSTADKLARIFQLVCIVSEGQRILPQYRAFVAKEMPFFLETCPYDIILLVALSRYTTLL